MTIVAKVWIEEDCIACDACADILPEVFDITDESSFIIADVREDGAFNRNGNQITIERRYMLS